MRPAEECVKAERRPWVDVRLSCPRCDRECKVPWSQLARGAECRGCNFRFAIGRNGKLESLPRPPQLYIVCPRCEQHAPLTTPLTSGHVECAGCKLQMLVDQVPPLHAASDRRRAAQPQWLGLPVLSKSHLSWAAALCAVLAIGMVLTVASSLRLFGPLRPEEAADRLTRQCLADEWATAAESVVDDEFQRMEFRRWCTLHFSSIRDRFRPRGDRTTIEVQALRSEAEQTVLRVTVRSPHLGSRSHIQCWRPHADKWLLDVVATSQASRQYRSENQPWTH